MAVVFIGVGSNLGDRRKNIRRAISCLRKIKGVTVEKVSALRETSPCGAGGPDYLNGVIAINTAIPPQKLLECLQEIENSLGRMRSFQNAPRIIDLDILLYGNRVVDRPGLKIPHPRMLERDFVIRPLSEIAPEWKKKLKNDFTRRSG